MTLSATTIIPPLPPPGPNPDHYRNAARELYTHAPYTCDAGGLFWLWNRSRSCYEQVDDYTLVNVLVSRVSLGERNVVAHYSRYLKALQLTGRLMTPTDLGSDWVQFGDDLVHIYNGKVEPARPALFCTNPIPHAVGKTAETPTIDKIFESWVGPSRVRMLYEWIAYCCYRDYPLHTILAMVGSGRNGKSTFLRFLSRYLGEQNVASTTVELLTTNHFETLITYRRLAVQMGETEYAVIHKTGILKSLTGQDLIRYEAKGKPSFTARNYAKVMIATNSLPSSADQSEGWYRRFLLQEFRAEFDTAFDILATIPEAEYAALSHKVVLVLPELLRRGYFLGQGNITAREADYIRMANPLPIYVDLFCERMPEGGSVSDYHVSYSEFRARYLSWLKGQKRRRVSVEEIRHFLDEEGFEIDRRQFTSERTTYILGFRWKELVTEVSMEDKSGRWQVVPIPSVIEVFSTGEARAAATPATLDNENGSISPASLATLPPLPVSTSEGPASPATLPTSKTATFPKVARDGIQIPTLESSVTKKSYARDSVLKLCESPVETKVLYDHLIQFDYLEQDAWDYLETLSFNGDLTYNQKDDTWHTLQ